VFRVALALQVFANMAVTRIKRLYSPAYRDQLPASWPLALVLATALAGVA
jgi:hypothetical protein